MRGVLLSSAPNQGDVIAELGGVSTDVLTAAGVLAALAFAVILWKLFKLTLKIVVFVVAAAVIAAVVALYVAGGRSALPTTLPSVVPIPDAPR